jgi:hypothetical protein
MEWVEVKIELNRIGSSRIGRVLEAVSLSLSFPPFSLMGNG